MVAINSLTSFKKASVVSAVNTRASAGLALETNEQGLDDYNWAELQNADAEIRTVRTWMKDGFPSEQEFRSSSQLVRALYKCRDTYF